MKTSRVLLVNNFAIDAEITKDRVRRQEVGEVA